MQGEYSYKKDNANKANKATNSKKVAKNTAFDGPEQVLNHISSHEKLQNIKISGIGTLSRHYNKNSSLTDAAWQIPVSSTPSTT